MNTAELYVEQVFVGLFVILIVLLPWLPELIDAMSKGIALANVVGGGSIIVGTAFVLGIPFDRLSDTLSDRLDKLQRLIVAFEQSQKFRNAPPKVAAGIPEKTPDDFYPEDKLLIRCLRDVEAVTDRYDYLRSRIRLARALAVYGPAITLAAAIGGTRYHNPVHWPLWFHFVVVGASYAAWFVWVQYANTRKSKCPLHLPRTDECKFLDHRDGSEFLKRFLKPHENGKNDERKSDLQLWCNEKVSLVFPIVMFPLALLLVFNKCDPLNAATVVATVAAGIVLVALAAWTWWRIARTQRDMLLLVGTSTEPGAQRNRGQEP